MHLFILSSILNSQTQQTYCYPMSKIPDFMEVELKIATDTLQARYGKPVEIQRADIELHIYSVTVN